MSQLVKTLSALGYGTRREIEALFAERRVSDANGVISPTANYDHGSIRVDGVPLDPPQGAVILLNKPVGYVCSTADASHPTVYELLPVRFPSRNPMMSPVGRLDHDTSGLLLVTDDGALNHQLTSPRSHLSKRYRVQLAQPLHGGEAATFASGELRLQSDPKPLAPAELQTIDDHTVHVTIHEGRYHQVRRMFAAVGNHVVSLTRVQFAQLTLEGVSEGAWRTLSVAERDQLNAQIRSARTANKR